MTNIRLQNLHIWIKILKRFYSLVFLGLWATFFYKSYFIYVENKPLINNIIGLEFIDDKSMFTPMIDLGIVCGKLIAIFIASLIIYTSIKRLFRNIPLPSVLIDKWNNTNQITPMLAHRLLNHYHYSTRISFYDFFNTYETSEMEAQILSYNFNNPNLQGLFKRFEPNLVSEINIYNTYFPKLTFWQKMQCFFTGKPPKRNISNNPSSLVSQPVTDTQTQEEKLSNLIAKKDVALNQSTSYNEETLENDFKDSLSNSENLVDNELPQITNKEPTLDDELLLNKNKA